METFTRSDGCPLPVVEGFRDRILSYRPSVTPKPHWADADYRMAAERKRKRFNRLLASLKHWHGSFQANRTLDVGCGDGFNCLLLAMQEPVQFALGIDLSLPALAADPRGERTRRLIDTLVAGQDRPPAEMLCMDATRMGFVDKSFQVVISRSAMEHIRPIEQALAEMVRVTQTGGIIYLGIDPFYWLRGCHKRGVVDIPWAHARLSLDDFETFVALTESSDAAHRRRKRLETLNRLTIAEWRQRIETTGCEILDWKLKQSELGNQLLNEHPEVAETLLPGILTTDLLTERIEVWLLKK